MAETGLKSNAQKRKESIKDVRMMMEEFVEYVARKGELYPDMKETGSKL